MRTCPWFWDDHLLARVTEVKTNLHHGLWWKLWLRRTSSRGEPRQEFQGRSYSADSEEMSWSFLGTHWAGGGESVSGRGDNMVIQRNRTPRWIKTISALGLCCGLFYSIQDPPQSSEHFLSLFHFHGPHSPLFHCFTNTRGVVFVLWSVFLMCDSLSPWARWPWPCPPFHLSLRVQDREQSCWILATQKEL